MFEILDMADSDMLFHFIAGLQPWAQVELKCQGVQSLQATIIAVDALLDLRLPEVQTTAPSMQHTFIKTKKRQGLKNQKKEPDSKQEKGTSEQKQIVCFICQGPHLERWCPRKQRISIVTTKEEVDQGAKASFNPLVLT